GVCTERGAIRLNWRLVHLQPELADYVVAHEVAHLVELNHSKRFWNLLETLYPDWRDAREAIELAGASLPQFREPE
ncbi:MAG: M48 family metallopeptidase, partial [Burkholderiales bacterium]